MGTRYRQSGFAVLEALLVVVILAIVAGTGYFVWHAKQNTDKSLSYTANSQPALQKKTSKKVANQTSTPVSYLTISEWKVKLKLTPSITKAYYQTSSFDPGFVFLSTEDLRNTTCSADNGGGGYIKRFSDGEMDSESKQSYNSEYPFAVKLGPYYYGFGVNPAYVKCSDDPQIQQKANDARSAFKESLNDIQIGG